MNRSVGRIAIPWVLMLSVRLLAAETMAIESPVSRQVFQREGFVPREAHPHAVGGPARGFADVPIMLRASGLPREQYRVRVLRMDDSVVVVDRSVATVGVKDDSLRLMVRIPAGGWYRIEILSNDNEPVVLAQVEPIGVGEVFLVAGQSYATNTNEEKFAVTDPAARVAAWNFKDGSWSVANDPQPTPDGSDGGSIWPPLGDQLAGLLQVPIGWANVAWGGTSSQQWLPGGDLHNRLVDAGKRLGRFRAVLWQQGESDVIGKTSIDQYVKNLTSIRQSADEAWGGSPRWLLAKSTLHPTVYNDPSGESRIRHAIDRLTAMPGFASGPDTDLLDGDRRGPMNSRRHFTGVGQRQAALLWFQSLWAEIHQPIPDHEIAQEKINDLHLTEYPWASSTAYRESSVLLLVESKPTARLAFPASEIVQVHAANGSHIYANGDYSLSSDGYTLTFASPGPIQPLREADLYPAAGSPGSYKHRVNHPDQGLLYAPERGFLDRQIEITYKKRNPFWSGPVPALAESSLPRTLSLLRSGKPIRIGVSGDSISFGWDASRMSDAPPFQFAYPSLLAAQLTELFGSKVDLVNRAVSGWSVAGGLVDAPTLLANKPDLIIVAYGMNDVGRCDPAWFAEQTKALVDKIKSSSDDVEIILVSPMVGNREWIHTPTEMFPLYRDELAKLVGPRVSLADVTAAWQTLLAHKHDLDLTGNGLNHPNDFGHRIYAQSILSLLFSPKP
ncbi:hypothetical protein K2X85_19715 [bacterium]|nr:hypothetical protein [bacterium]